MDFDGNGAVARQPVIDLTGHVPEPKGVVYTRPWVVELILDLAGYRAGEDLAGKYAVEPAAGDGAFLVAMARRLLASALSHGRPLSDARGALRAYELDEASATQARQAATNELARSGVARNQAARIAHQWVTVDDYLVGSQTDREADFVIGNPPYIRYDDLPTGLFDFYRRRYQTMQGRGDLYVGFIEAGVRQLRKGGVLAFICADRWMRSSYGAELRRLIGDTCSVEAVVEMHDAPAFEDEVSAYPAVTVLRKQVQGRPIVAVAGRDAGPLELDGTNLADAVINLADGHRRELTGFAASRLDGWFTGSRPWPSLESGRLAVLRELERRLSTLEDPYTATKVGIGVATGRDEVYVTVDPDLVEADRLLPLAMAADTRSGKLVWSGHYLVNPWLPDGRLVPLGEYPRLEAYLEQHRPVLTKRNIAQRRTTDWYRTIDRVNHPLASRAKLYFPDMKATSNPTLDSGTTYPHHNLYWLTSDCWDLEVLGGLLLSRVAQLFIEAYSVRMRGGTLRFQAQYLRQVRVPKPSSLDPALRGLLVEAFRSRDVDLATKAAIDAYGVHDAGELLGC